LNRYSTSLWDETGAVLRHPGSRSGRTVCRGRKSSGALSESPRSGDLSLTPLPNLVTLVAFFFSVADLPLLPLLVLQAAVQLTAYVPCFFFFLCTA